MSDAPQPSKGPLTAFLPFVEKYVSERAFDQGRVQIKTLIKSIANGLIGLLKTFGKAVATEMDTQTRQRTESV